MRIWKRARRTWRRAIAHATGRPRTKDDRAIAWLWPYLALSTNRAFPPRYENRDALILQMGRVASISIYHAMRACGYNAFHTHGISESARSGTLMSLKSKTRQPKIDALRGHTAALAHHELMVWYRMYKRRNGHRLKIITVTRDPATWIGSHLILLRHKTLPLVRDWYAAHAGLAAGPPIDDLAALRAAAAEIGRIILAIRPSRGLQPALSDLHSMAKEDGGHGLAQLARSGLSCADWFSHELAPLIGVDPLGDPSLRERGYACFDTDHAEIMVLRFEDLRRLTPTLGAFLGIPDFELPHANATSRTSDRAALSAAFEAGIEDAGGALVRRELRATPYARSCGYDRLTD
ncbi:MAG TPA: putative capsular polysaccharide synthesis family protein [Dongiaceae bacterium]